MWSRAMWRGRRQGSVTLRRGGRLFRRHDGCGSRTGKVELITGIEGASSRPVRKIVLREG
jgi:hypothetical protein